jgi:hypothetical protein
MQTAVAVAMDLDMAGHGVGGFFSDGVLMVASGTNGDVSEAGE